MHTKKKKERLTENDKIYNIFFKKAFNKIKSKF